MKISTQNIQARNTSLSDSTGKEPKEINLPEVEGQTQVALRGINLAVTEITVRIVHSATIFEPIVCPKCLSQWKNEIKYKHEDLCSPKKNNKARKSTESIVDGRSEKKTIKTLHSIALELVSGAWKKYDVVSKSAAV